MIIYNRTDKENGKLEDDEIKVYVCNHTGKKVSKLQIKANTIFYITRRHRSKSLDNFDRRLV